MPSKDIEQILKNAEYDLKFLLNRNYRKRVALNLVANKYLLDRYGRNFLVRKVYSNKIAHNRRVKIEDIYNIKNKIIIIDGYNVLITSESIYNEEYGSVIMCDDGVLRDNNAVFGKYKNSLSSKKALISIITLLKNYNPDFIYFIYDSPVSKSGELAKMTESLIKIHGMDGSAVINKNVDFELVKLSKEWEGIVATSDGAVMDRVKHILDIPYWICDILK